jgi:hypothetical protein
MTDRVTLGVQFDPDSELLEEFEEYKENNGFTSRAETMRHLMREELQSDGDRYAELAGSSGWAALSVSLAGLALGSTTPAGAAAGLAAVLFVLSAVTRWRGGR